MGAPVYRSGLTDSSRWERVEPRPGDIVISAPSKCGTTWLQMICALLIFRTPELPAPLTTLSPWVDMRLRPLDELLRALDGQRHRRFLKTHSPLDGLPAAPGVSYLVIGRDPRDVAISMDHHRANLDDHRIRALLAATPSERRDDSDQRERILRWFSDQRHPTENLDSLRGVTAHLRGAWQRRHAPEVLLLHHADLRADLHRQMDRIAEHLRLDAPTPALVEAATFTRMRSRADDLAPDERLGLFTDNQAFFRSGRPEQWRAILTDDDVRDYLERLRPSAFTNWLHAATT